MPHIKKRVWVPLAGLVVVLCALAVWRFAVPHAQMPLEDFRYLPADAAIAANIDVSALRNSTLVRAVVQSQATPEMEKDYAEFVRSTGFNFETDLDSVALSVSGRDEARTLNAVLRGRFDRSRFQQYIDGRRQSSSARRGTTIDVLAGPSGRTFRLAFADSDRLLFSNSAQPAAMNDMVDLVHHYGAPIEKRLKSLNLMEHLQPQSQAWVCADMDKAGTLSFPFSGGSPGSPGTSFTADLLRGSRLVLTSAHLDNENLELRMVADYPTEAEARRVAQSLSGLRALLSALATRQKPRVRAPTNLSRALDQIQISVENKAAVLRWSIANSLVEELLRGSVKGS